MSETIKFYADEPTESDALKRNGIAQTFADIALSCETPLVIGLYGGWGTGKTSLMKQIEKLVGAAHSANPPLTLWFNPWMFQGSDNPVLPLLNTLVDKFDIRSKDKVKESMTLIVGGMLSGLLNKSTGLGIADIEALAKRYEEEKGYIRDTQGLLNSQFEKIIKAAKGDADKRLVFFIDDLDRCMPEQTLKLLEALKLYFNHQGCVYFLGVDHDALERSVQKTYGEYKIDGKSYLDKIVQLPFHIPPIEKGSMAGFIDRIELEGELAQCKQALVEGLGDNPRSVKRFINTLKLTHMLAKNTEGIKENYNVQHLLLVQLVLYLMPDVFKEMVKPGRDVDGIKKKIEMHESMGPVAKIVPIPDDLTVLTPYLHLTQITATEQEEEDTSSNKVRRLSKAELDDILVKHEKFLNRDSDGERADLAYCDLQGAMLTRANLTWADLRGADLLEASLQEADLQGADLILARGLTVKQLSVVKSLYMTDGIPSEIEAELRETHPHLFEPPK